MRIIVLLALLISCSRSPQPLTPAFFCWETTFQLPPETRGLMDSLHCRKLYIKVLDIGLNQTSGEIEPYSVTQFADTAGLQGVDRIPCVFITNEVFSHIASEKSVWMAGKIAENIARGPCAGAREALFDCDWTASTRTSFFRFLEHARAALPKNMRISATIRLHQYKSPDKTGIPPADRGMLMFYNTGDVDEPGGRNNIFHPADAEIYLNAPPYPLPLDLALPLFSWACVFREGELWKIIPGPLPLDDMRSSGKYDFFPRQNAFDTELWTVKAGTFLGGHYLRPADQVRVSSVSPELLLACAQSAHRLHLANDATLSFFQLHIAQAEGFSAALLDSARHIVRP